MKSIVKLPLFLLLMLCLAGLTSASADDRVVKDGDAISIHYTGKLDDSTVFDSSKGREPLEFTAGSDQIIPGMNKAVMGMHVGETRTVNIPPEDAYGPRHDQLIFEVEMKQLPPGVEAGAQLVGPDQRMVVVKEIKGDKAVLDANHFLAGKTLIFEIELVSIH